MFGVSLQPLNLLGLIDIFNPMERYCYQASYASEVAGPIVVKVALGTTECTWGGVGSLLGQDQGCQMQEYYPKLPMYIKNFKNPLSFSHDFVQRECIGWYS